MWDMQQLSGTAYHHDLPHDWTKVMRELHRTKKDKWWFILIDKDFRIINSYAELPSDKNIEVILNNILK